MRIRRMMNLMSIGVVIATVFVVVLTRNAYSIETLTSTDSLHVVNLLVGCELAMSKEKFSQSFPLVGLRVQNRFWGGEGTKTEGTKTVEYINALTLLLEYNLSSIVAQSKNKLDETVFDETAQKALDFNIGLLWEGWKDFRILHNVTLGFLLSGGGVNAKEDNNNMLWRWFSGLRLSTKSGDFKGAYFELGYGESENFTKGKRRIKIKGFLPICKAKTFISWFVDSDGFGDNEDEMKIILGKSIDIEKVFNIFNLVSSESN